eukprot:scaffold9100_cov64-Attheya_sp.AAC.2
MEETRLPIKMLSCWLPNPRPAHQCPPMPTTNRNSLMRSLQIMDPNISKHGILNKWFPSAQNEEEWNQRIENIFYKREGASKEKKEI